MLLLYLTLPLILYGCMLIPVSFWTFGSLLTEIYAALPPAHFKIWDTMLRGLSMVMSLLVFVGIAAVFWLGISVLIRPVYGWVAARVEGEAWEFRLEPEGVFHSILFFLVFLAMDLLISGVLLVPLAGEVLAPLLWWLSAALWLSRELVEIPMSRRLSGFRAKLAFVWHRLPELLGLGMVTSLGLLVPVLDCWVLPAAFVGATLMVRDFFVEAR